MFESRAATFCFLDFCLCITFLCHIHTDLVLLSLEVTFLCHIHADMVLLSLDITSLCHVHADLVMLLEPNLARHSKEFSLLCRLPRSCAGHCKTWIIPVAPLLHSRLKEPYSKEAAIIVLSIYSELTRFYNISKALSITIRQLEQLL